MKWFGPPWEAGVCTFGTQVSTPTAELCFACKEHIRHGDRGVRLPYTNEEGVTTEPPWHLGCLTASIFPAHSQVIKSVH